jgi:1-acyl-sn-glycerol-3-phosphate acyltransferase
MWRASRHAGRGLFHALAELGAVRMAPPRDPRASAHRLAGALGMIARAHDLSVTLSGDIPRGAALLVANQVSYLDLLAILPACPALPVVPGELLGWPIVGPIGAALGVVFVRRADPLARISALRRIHDLLAAEASVLDFAAPHELVGPFWRGSFGIARRLSVPVVPVAIRYRDPARTWTGEDAFLPHYIRTAGAARVEIAVRFGEPMFARTGEPPEAMAARARGTIGHLLERTR